MIAFLKTFNGYKTYIVASVSILFAVTGYLVGDVSLIEAAKVVETAVIGATIRNAIK